MAVTETTALEPCELETVTFPVTDSALFGAKVTFIAALIPAPSVKGVVMPLALTSLALTAIWEIVRLEFPLFVIVTLFEPVLPAAIFPKLTLDGLADMVTEAVVPVPLRATELGELGALLAMLTFPLSEPAVVGANCAVNVVLCPAASVAGVPMPLTL